MAKVCFWHLDGSVTKQDNLLARTRESDAICTRVHGACCRAVSRHPVQALDVRGRVPGGAAQSSSQFAPSLCSAMLLDGKCSHGHPGSVCASPSHTNGKYPRHAPEALLLSLRNCLWDDSAATKL